MRRIATLLSAAAACVSFAADQTDFVPKAGQFPPADAGKVLAGELVAVDHINRRGALRLDGDGSEGTYHSAPPHRFALLPYGTVRYHGAPAELRDIPLGTHLHGRFLRAPADDPGIKPAGSSEFAAQTHAVLLEDDFSFHQRQSRAWEVKAVELAKGTLTLSLPGPKPAVFTLDRSTRVWKGRAAATLEDIATRQSVLANFTWAPDWQNGQMHTSDVWLDDESRALAAEQQRQLHLRHTRHRWLPGWVEHVDHKPDGKGAVTLTIFGGAEPELYAEVRKARSFAVAAAEPTLRSWWQNHDAKQATLIDLRDAATPGGGGLQLRLRFEELLDGFRPARIIRIRTDSWPNSKLPPEERIQSLSDRDTPARP